MKKSMALFHIKKFSCHVALVTFKKKTSTCGSQVGHAHVGHIRIALLVSGSNGSTGVTHFQPWPGLRGKLESSHHSCIACETHGFGTNLTPELASHAFELSDLMHIYSICS